MSGRIGVSPERLSSKNRLNGTHKPLLFGKQGLKRVNFSSINISLLYHSIIGISRNPLAQRGESDKNRGEKNKGNNGDTDADKKVGTRQLEGELRLEGVSVHHHEAMLMLDDIGHRLASQL